MDVKTNPDKECRPVMIGGFKGGNNWFSDMNFYTDYQANPRVSYLKKVVKASMPGEENADDNYRNDASKSGSIYCAPNSFACGELGGLVSCDTDCYNQGTNAYALQAYYMDEGTDLSTLYRGSGCDDKYVDLNRYKDIIFTVQQTPTLTQSNHKTCDRINEAPTASNVKIIPENPTAGDDLICNFTYSDPENFEEKDSRFEWWKNSINQNINSQVLGKGNLTVNDQWSCRVIPSDGLAEGAQQSSSTVSISTTVSSPKIYVEDSLTWSSEDYYSGSEIITDVTGGLNNALQSCTPDEEGYCNIPITFSSDSTGKLAISDLGIYYEEQEINLPPILDPIQDMTVNETDLVNITVNAIDLDNDPLYYYINDSRFEQNNNTFTWQTPDSSAGIYIVNITVGDYEFNVSQLVTITVNDPYAPFLNIISPIDNSVYHTTSVDLNWTVNEKVDWCGYSLDGGDNITLINNNVECWGNNYYGQCNDYTQNHATQITAGGYHTCILKSNGNVECWGYNGSGQSNPYNNGDAIQVSAGGYHTCILKSNGNVECWGKNDYDQSNPYNNGDAIQVAAGGYHTCILKSNGDVECWGYNGHGQSNPYNGGDATYVATGAAHTCFLKSSNNVECRGWNECGQSEPYTNGDAINVTASEWHTCILKSNGNVECRGCNFYNQSNDYNKGDAIQVSAGIWHTCILKSNGNVECWGENDDGQSNPYNNGDAIQVSAGGWYTCVITPPQNTILTNLSQNHHNITIYCNDTEGNIGQSDYVYFSVEINEPPILDAITDIKVNESDLVNITVKATDPENDPLYYYINDSRFTQDKNIFTWQTPDGSAGIYIVNITVGDYEFNVSQLVTIRVNDVCIPNWIEINTTCNPDDTKTGYYVDEDSCYEKTNLPSDLIGQPENNTYECNYCSKIITGPFNTSCEESNTLTQYYVDKNFETCCLITSLESDCSIIYDESYQDETLWCDYCTPDLINTSWTGWLDIICLPDDTMNQSRNRTQSDSNYCGEVDNVTYYEYRHTEPCDYCTPSLVNTSWSDWINEGECLIDDTQQQKRTRIQYDENYCGEVEDITFTDSKNIECDYCIPEWYEINETCQPDDTFTGWYKDSNNCYAITGLDADNNPPPNNTYACDYCIPDWVGEDNPCERDDKQLISYTDTNNCNEDEGLPVDNGTYLDCNYCASEWLNINSSCGYGDYYNVTYVYTNDCCAVTGLLLDCNIPENTTAECNYCSEDIQGPLYTDWTDCNKTDLQSRIIYYQDNNYETCCLITNIDSDCNINNGAYDDAKEIHECDYCIPSWAEVNESCTKENTLNAWYNDTNNCYAITALESDIEGKPAYKTYACLYIWNVSITLNKGWNLVSIPLNLTNKSIKHLFEGCSYVFSYDNLNKNWLFYRDDSYNNFNELDEKMGLWIESSKDKELVIKGYHFDYPITIPLYEGWNLIGYPSLNSSLINETLDDYISVYAYNNSRWLSSNNKRPKSFNTIHDFVPRLGYWVYVSEEGELTVYD